MHAGGLSGTAARPSSGSHRRHVLRRPSHSSNRPPSGDGRPKRPLGQLRVDEQRDNPPTGASERGCRAIGWEVEKTPRRPGPPGLIQPTKAWSQHAATRTSFPLVKLPRAAPRRRSAASLVRERKHAVYCLQGLKSEAASFFLVADLAACRRTYGVKQRKSNPGGMLHEYPHAASCLDP